jgi:hypothetical protein
MIVFLYGSKVVLYCESACSNCIVLLEPTDVVIVGVSQIFAEMFSRFTYLHNLLGVKQVKV